MQIKRWELKYSFSSFEFPVFFTYSLKWNDNASVQRERIVEKVGLWENFTENTDDDIHKEYGMNNKIKNGIVEYLRMLRRAYISYS